MMSAMSALSPATTERRIDTLDKVYTRLMLGEKQMNRQAEQVSGKASVVQPTRQLKRQVARLRTKQAQIKARMDAAKQIG